MLERLIRDLAEASNKKAKEQAYRRLEQVGMDRGTADKLATEMYKKKVTEEEALNNGN